MNDLALIAIGGGLGFALALIAVMVYVLWTTAAAMRRAANASITKSTEATASLHAVVGQMRTELATSLSRMDAERLYEASLAVQRSAKSLSAQIATLQKVVFAQPAPPAFDLSPETFGIEDEAADDARMLAEQARWAQPDPLAGLSEEEKNRRMQQFFEQRRQNGISRFGSAPPTAGAGAYASLIEEAQQQTPPAKPPGDFDDAGEEGFDATGRGELDE